MSIPRSPAPVNAGCGRPPSVYTEALAPTRSSKHRGFTWEPHGDIGCACRGTLVVTTDRSRGRYELAETYVSPGYGTGRAFRLTKPDGAAYDVFLADDRQHSTCDCEGFLSDASRKADRRHGDRSETLGCKHLDAVASLIWNRWLPDPREDAGADVGPTDPPAWSRAESPMF